MFRVRSSQEEDAGVTAAPRMAVPGIQNLGNTCFFNAILQALAATESVREYLTQVLAQSQQRRHQVPFTKALAECIVHLTAVDQHEPHATVVPKDLNRALCNKLVAFRGNKQQDSQELLQFLINLVNDEQKECARSDGGLKDFFSAVGAAGSLSGSASSSTASSSFGGSISDLCFEDSMEERRWNPLYGLQVDLLQCAQCGLHRPMTNRRFLDISLSFADATTSRKPVTLWDCLATYTSPEVIAGVECSFCTATEELKLKQRECDALQQRVAAAPHMCDVETELALHQLKDDVYRLDALVNKVDEIFQLDVKDERCRALHNCFKRLQFSRCPDVLCFHFNRKVFHAHSGSTRKLDTHVVFPVELDMSPFCRFEQSANGVAASTSATKTNGNGGAHANGNGHGRGKPHHTAKSHGRHAPSQAGFSSRSATASDRRHQIYELVAVVLHHGNDRYGHFTAFRRVRRSSQWFFISDNNVREATEDEVLASCAYMLFYERKYRSQSTPMGTANGSINGTMNGHSPRHGSDKHATQNGHHLNGYHKRSTSSGDDEIDHDDEDNEDALARVPDESSLQARNR